MTDLFPVVGVSSTWRKPGNFTQLLFNQGTPAGQQPGRDILLLGPKLSGGTFTNNVIVQVKFEADVIAGSGGAGTDLHRMFRMVTKANQGSKVFVLPYAETSGGSPVAASTTITGSGTANALTMWTLLVCGLP